jgi:hypothetical protein
MLTSTTWETNRYIRYSTIPWNCVGNEQVGQDSKSQIQAKERLNFQAAGLAWKQRFGCSRGSNGLLCVSRSDGSLAKLTYVPSHPLNELLPLTDKVV